MIAPRQVGEKFAEFPHSSEYLRAARFKQSVGMEFVDQQREDWMHGYLQRANRGPLSAQGLRELYEHLLELTKRETAARAG